MNNILSCRLAAYGLTTSLAICSQLALAQADIKPDALLAIDLNRVAVVERIVEQWKAELGGLPAESFRGKLMALRADQLMSATLSGSFDAVLEQLNAAQHGAAVVVLAPEAALSGVVDATSLERMMERSTLINRHAKAIGEIDKDLVYTPIAPCNLMDTRPGVSPVPPEGGPSLLPGYVVRAVQVSGRCAIPAGAKGIAALYTIENNPSTGGVVFAGDAGGTGGAVVSWSAPSQYASGAGITPLSTAGAMQLQSAGGTHIKVDVTGYFMPPTRAGNGLRIVQTVGSSTNAPSTLNGSISNSIGSSTVQGATVAGGGRSALTCFDAEQGVFERDCANFATNHFATVSGGYSNVASAEAATVGGGAENTAKGTAGFVGGGIRNTAGNFGRDYDTVGGGTSNSAVGGQSTVAGGGFNLAASRNSTVAGGSSNYAAGIDSTIPGGYANQATGEKSFASGNLARATHFGSFVWSDGQSNKFYSVADNSFNIRALGGVHLNTDTSLSFGSQVRQMINLWSTQYGIGTQASSTYFRSGMNFAWYQNGVHTDTDFAAGTGGAVLMALRPSAVATAATGVAYAQSFVNNSDVTLKTAFAKVNALDVLKKVVAMPITSWAYKSDAKARHIGPMAQDFAKAFGLGAGDKNIATVDADGVALAAIQGLNQKLVAESKAKDAKISAQEVKISGLERANDSIQRELAAIKKRLGL